MSLLYVPLSTEWADHPKLIRAGLAGRGLHALTLAIAKRLETDGWVDRLLLHREGADDDLIDRLVDLRLLDVDEAHPDAVRPHNWHRHNPTQASIEAGRAAKAEAGITSLLSSSSRGARTRGPCARRRSRRTRTASPTSSPCRASTASRPAP